MYFSIGDIKHDRAAQLAVITAQELGEHILAHKESHIPFETVVCTLKEKIKRDLTVIAAQLLAQDEGKKQSALQVGFKEITRIFGGDDAAMSFFRQVTTPRATIRFESVGGVQDDIHAAKNRSAVLAAKAVVERFREPNRDGFSPAEREYVDYLKSIRSNLEKAADNGVVDANIAMGLVAEIEEAAYTDARPNIRGKIMELQIAASEEVFKESRSRLIQQYAQALEQGQAPAPNNNSGPTLH